MERQPLITLTTDFGLSDHFVGTMKGVMLAINPLIQFVDISHHVTPHDIFDGALTLALAYPYFPDGAIHLAIVDPGVGSARRPIVVRTGGHMFVAPDNGLLSLVYEREKTVEAWHVTAEHYFLKPVSHTFHGRDVFAPVAAWLSKGVRPEKFGAAVTDYVKCASPKPERLENGGVRGVVIKADQFGNLITNIGPSDAPRLFAPEPPPFRITINKQEVARLYTSYSTGQPAEVFAIAGSSGFIEIVQNRASAAKTLGAVRGAEVILLWT